MDYGLIGVPKKLYQNFSVANYITSVEYDHSVFLAKAQKNVFQKLLKNPFMDSYILLLSSKSINTTAQMAAKLLMEEVLKKGGTPFWFNVLQYQKEFKRLEAFKDNFNGIDFLIIDGLFSKTNINYIDCLRTLLSVYDDIPVVTIISGCTGIEFFKQQVFCGFNKFVHFGDEEKTSLASSVDGLPPCDLDELD